MPPVMSCRAAGWSSSARVVTSGLINTIKQAMAVSGVAKLHAVLGGFHLVTAPQDYIDQTVNELEALKPDVVVPMHCSGGLHRDDAPPHAGTTGDWKRRRTLHLRRLSGRAPDSTSWKNSRRYFAALH